MTVEAAARDTRLRAPRLADTETTGEPALPVILVLLAAFTAIWAVYLTISEAPVAIKHDMAEAYAWGQEFQLGYNQHPPFWAWICGLWFSLFPRTGWAFALLSSLNAAIGLGGAWMLLGEFAYGRKRMAAWVLLLLTPIYTFYAYKYDANTIFLSIWPWALCYFMKSMRTRKIGDSIAFGICVGLAMMSKYYAVVLVATCFLAALQHPAWRKYRASASPWIAAAVAALIFAPHVWWLLTHRAPPLRYLVDISGQPWDEVLDYAQKTLVDGLGMNLGVVLVVGLVAWISRRDGTATFSPDPRSPPLRVLATLVLTPLALTIATGLALRTRNTPEMTLGTFPLFPLLAVELARVRDTDRLYRIASRLACVVTLGALALSPAIAAMRTYLSPTAMKIPPYQEAAAEATRLWHEQTSRPLAYVGGSDWWENAIAFYSTDRPQAFVHLDYARNLWVTPEALAKGGLLSLCFSDDQACLNETAPFVTPETTRTELSLAHKFWGHVARPVQFVVTIIPPHAEPR
jgi:4-amino-4-deoxy-L-arabinose transferase-like glycosyltransferase